MKYKIDDDIKRLSRQNQIAVMAIRESKNPVTLREIAGYIIWLTDMNIDNDRLETLLSSSLSHYQYLGIYQVQYDGEKAFISKELLKEVDSVTALLQKIIIWAKSPIEINKLCNIASRYPLANKDFINPYNYGIDINSFTEFIKEKLDSLVAKDIFSYYSIVDPKTSQQDSYCIGTKSFYSNSFLEWPSNYDETLQSLKKLYLIDGLSLSHISSKGAFIGYVEAFYYKHIKEITYNSLYELRCSLDCALTKSLEAIGVPQKVNLHKYNIRMDFVETYFIDGKRKSTFDFWQSVSRRNTNWEGFEDSVWLVCSCNLNYFASVAVEEYKKSRAIYLAEKEKSKKKKKKTKR